RGAALPIQNVVVRVVLYHGRKRILAHTARPGAAAFAASISSGAVRAGRTSVALEETAQGRAYVVVVEPWIRLVFQGPPGRPPATGPRGGPVWDLASMGLKVAGEIQVVEGNRRRTLEFQGEGVHDHGFGPSWMVPAVRSWSWGWAHAREFGVAWRQMLLASGEVETLLVADRDGAPILGEAVHSRPFRTRYSLLGIPYRRCWRLDGPSGAGLAVERLTTLASSPLGMRFLSSVRFSLQDPSGRLRLVEGIGLSSVARPCRVGVAPIGWLALARERWTGRRAADTTQGR
ncbi:MAG: hypothetical protein ACE5ID_10170, partial [Acidobacteriota bacterium]